MNCCAGFRDHVIFSLALGTTLREHEILAFDIGDVFDEAGRSRRRVQLRVFKRSNDDPDAQEVVLPDALRAKLDKFLGWKRLYRRIRDIRLTQRFARHKSILTLTG